MTGGTPGILVAAGDWDERVLIAATLREAGFAVVAADDRRGAVAALRRERFAAAVIALADGEGIALLDSARACNPELRALMVVEPATLRDLDPECETIVRRPFDVRQLLGCMFELVLRDEEDATAPRHSQAAELGIAAAKLACLYNRQAIAAAAGAGRLARELGRQIGETHASHQVLAAAALRGAAMQPAAAD